MRQDWVEFKKNTTEKIRLRSLRIVGIHELPFDMEKNITARTLLSYEVGKTVKEYLIDEPYDQVKQKIRDAEKVDLDNVVVEHFTSDEYSLLNMALFELLFGDVRQLDSREAELIVIHKKLQNIIKGEA